MMMPRDEGIQKESIEGWRVFVNNLEKGFDIYAKYKSTAKH